MRPQHAQIYDLFMREVTNGDIDLATANGVAADALKYRIEMLNKI